MADVKVLVSGNGDFGICDKGDVVEVISSAQDWGEKTVAPDWVRVTIDNVPGNQEEAENRIRNYLVDWKDVFLYSAVSGGSEGKERYRIEIKPDFSHGFNMGNKHNLHSEVLSAFNGTVVTSTARYLEFDAESNLPMDELKNVISWATFRRFRIPDSVVDTALDSIPEGESVLIFYQWSWFRKNIKDKLKE